MTTSDKLLSLLNKVKFCLQIALFYLLCKQVTSMYMNKFELSHSEPVAPSEGTDFALRGMLARKMLQDLLEGHDDIENEETFLSLEPNMDRSGTAFDATEDGIEVLH